jgi:hypothetical protein
MPHTVDNYKNLKNKRIKIFTRSFSPELYKYSSYLYKNKGIETVRLLDQSAEGYFFEILKDLTCDIAINIDEDAFISDFNIILNLADYMIEHGYANSGCPDCSPGCPRAFNPIVINPFFNIMNLELIRKKNIHEQKKIQAFDYNQVKQEMIEKYPSEILKEMEYSFDFVDVEPYYTFFLWLAYHFKTLYLPSKRHNDKISTILYDLDDNIICKHSWFARRYRVLKVHTNRINNLIDEVYNEHRLNVPKFKYKDKILIYLELIIRYKNKIIYRILRLPKKLKKKYFN